MEIEPLSLKHQKILTQKFATLELNLSDYLFSNMYFFRNIHKYRVAFEKQAQELFIIGRTRDGLDYFMPTSHPTSWLENRDVLEELPKVCYPIPKIWLSYFDKQISQVSFSEADSDYLFKTENIALLVGKHLKTKRGLINQLIANHPTIKTLDYQEKYFNQLNELLDKWQSNRSLDSTDYLECKQCLEHFIQFDLRCRVVYIEDNVVGFLIGQQLNKNCFVFHFAKFLKEIRGLPQYMFQGFAQVLKNDFFYLNFEEDLGKAGIRLAKQSYDPVQLEHKYRVFLNKVK